MHNGTFTYFDYPGEIRTIPTGINDYGLIVGLAGVDFGFLYDGNQFTPLRDNNHSATFPFGINNANLVTGGTGTIYTTRPFEMGAGHYRELSVPELSVYTDGHGINNLGIIVGSTDDKGFWCKAGKCQLNSCPGAIQTDNIGINDQNMMVGWCVTGPPYAVHAFVSNHGRYLLFDYPGTDATSASGINAAGQIVGEFTSDYKVYHGFVTSPVRQTDSP